MDDLLLALATVDDSDAVFAWRNDPQTRAASVSQAPVSREEHVRWYERVLEDPKRRLYIAKNADARVGLCRFDIEGDTAEISINLNPDYRGRGLAAPILSQSITAFRAEHNGVRSLTATIRPENAASVRTFTAFGFILDSSEVGLNHYVLATGG